MPKQIYKIENFHGGLNTDSDPRDVADNELPVLTDLVVDEVGKIRMMGGNADHGAPDPTDHTLRAGYGLFYFTADRKGAHVIEGHLTGAHDAGTSNTTLTDSGHGWPVDGLIGATVNNTTDGSSGTVQDNDATSALLDDLLGGDNDNFENLDVYTITDFPETGDDYLISVDCDATASALVYSRLSDTWIINNYPIKLGSTANVEPTYYAVDGGLRVSDGNFGASNTNQWYSYIDREYLQSLGGNSVEVNQWKAIEQKVDKPAATSGFDDVTADAFTDYDEGPTIFATSTTKTDTDWFSTENQIYADDNAMDNVSRIIVTVWATATASSNNELSYTIQAGEGSSSAFTANSQTQEATGTVGHSGYYQSFYFYFNAVGPQIPISSSGAPQGIRVLLTDVANGSSIDDFQILTAKCWAGVFAGSTHANLAANNVMFEIDGAGSAGSGWSKNWNVGVSFIYDEVQESLVREMLDVDSPFADTCTIGSNEAPDIKLSIKYTGWNPRITGINLYMREATAITKESWFLQAHYDLIKGVGRAYPNGVDNNFVYETSISESQCSIPKEELLSPNLVDHYELVAGMNPDERSIISKYKTAVVVNRVVYIGGLEVHYEDGTTEVMGDAMIKSPVNKFDLFPLSRIIEVSVRDGDSIIKLEEYADRILQFKKNKMHLVNVSQEIEFLEDTFMHKGVSTPAAVCKTDFGVAWVNQHGCYLYDGKQVHNLLEKGGRKLISDDDWEGFITVKDESDNVPGGSMIGYIPKKRQLIVVRDSHNSSNSGDIYLYDMVTQSWTFGDSKLVGTGGAEERKTNFINDWNGDLVHLNDEDSGSVFKWDDAADTSTTLSLVTKDIDFGQPAQRKKIYRVYITYKSGATTNVQVDYDVNGGTTFPYDFENGTNFASTELASASGWQVAELKPDTSSEANNVKSFKLRFATDGTVPVGFEINDISIVYRLKNVK